MIAYQPGLVVLLGSGETSPTIRKIYDWLFARLDPAINIGILETPAGFEPNSDRVAGQIADFMEKHLQNFRPRISVVAARRRGTPFSPDDAQIVTPLLDANVIMMGPGSPTYTVRQLKGSVAWYTLNARHRLGASLVFASATTIASSAHALPVYEIYKVGEDLHWKPGLSFFEPFGLSLVFIPHWNNNDGGVELDTSRCYMGKYRYNQLVQMLPGDLTIVGIDERTALVVEPSAETCQVMGNGNVTLVRGGREKVFLTGQTFDVCELGPFHCPSDLRMGIPYQVWDWVFAAQSEAEEHDSEPVPPPEAVSLLEERSAARALKDWSHADALRSQIEAMGWKILDTPEGSRLEPK
jgi:hypothetical protein